MSQMMLTGANRTSLPALYSTDGQGMNAIAQVRYFWGGAGEMLVTEFDGEDTLYGYFPNTGDGEWGYASLREFTASNRGQINGCERDYYFTPATVGDATN